MSNKLHTVATFLIVATLTFGAGLCLFSEAQPPNTLAELKHAVQNSGRRIKAPEFDPVLGSFLFLLLMFVNAKVRSTHGGHHTST
jgi:hypothetical protein